MVAEVNKIIAGELLNHRAVTIPGVGTLCVVHRNARRLSRRQIAVPRNVVDFRPAAEGVTLAELIRRVAGCDEAQAQAIFERWLARTREEGVLTLEGIGTLRGGLFTADRAFAARLNPAGDDVVTLQPRMNRFVVGIAVAAIAVAVGVLGYIEFGPKSVVRLVARSERPQPRSAQAADGKRVCEPVVEEMPAAPISRDSALEPQSASAAMAAAQTVEQVATTDAAASAAVEEPKKAEPEVPEPKKSAPKETVSKGPEPKASVSKEIALPAAQPASDRLQAGWCYVVFGVFSTGENAARCREQLLRNWPSLTVGVYPFGAKYMVSPFAAQDRADCERFMREHRPVWSDLWIYAKK